MSNLSSTNLCTDGAEKSRIDNDLECDGEAIVHPTSQSVRPYYPSQKIDNHHSSDKDGLLSPREDSGLGSILSEPEKNTRSSHPVQCSDNKNGRRQDDIAKEFSKMSLLSEDEGINSMPCRPYSVTESIEIDLFEQDTDGDTLIHTAIVSMRAAVAFVLIELATVMKECLNIQNELHQTPLHLAVHTKQPEIVHRLVEAGADVTVRDKQGNTPLHIACRNGQENIVKMLVSSLNNNTTLQQKFMSVRNCEGLTPLHIASENRYFEIMGYLFAKEADVNIGDAKSGRTILHFAVERRDKECVVKLLAHPDIDIDCKTYKGETALVLAYWRNYQDIVKILTSKGAFFSYDLLNCLDDEDS